MSLRRSPWSLALGVAAVTLAASCASVEFTRETQTSGRFKSKGFEVTLFSYDIPAPALVIARDNVSDARLTNYQVDEARVWPYLGGFDWLLDIIGMRWATVGGTWGFDGAEPTSTPAK